MNWQAVYPEILLLTAACLVALVDLWVKDPKRLVTYSLTQASLFLLAMLQLWYFADGSRDSGPTPSPSMRCSAWWWPTRWATCSACSPPWR